LIPAWRMMNKCFVIVLTTILNSIKKSAKFRKGF